MAGLKPHRIIEGGSLNELCLKGADGIKTLLTENGLAGFWSSMDAGFFADGGVISAVAKSVGTEIIKVQKYGELADGLVLRLSDYRKYGVEIVSVSIGVRNGVDVLVAGGMDRPRTIGFIPGGEVVPVAFPTGPNNAEGIRRVAGDVHIWDAGVRADQSMGNPLKDSYQRVFVPPTSHAGVFLPTNEHSLGLHRLKDDPIELGPQIYECIYPLLFPAQRAFCRALSEGEEPDPGLNLVMFPYAGITNLMQRGFVTIEEGDEVVLDKKAYDSLSELRRVSIPGFLAA